MHGGERVIEIWHVIQRVVRDDHVEGRQMLVQQLMRRNRCYAGFFNPLDASVEPLRMRVNQRYIETMLGLQRLDDVEYKINVAASQKAQTDVLLVGYLVRNDGTHRVHRPGQLIGMLQEEIVSIFQTHIRFFGCHLFSSLEKQSRYQLRRILSNQKTRLG